MNGSKNRGKYACGRDLKKKKKKKKADKGVFWLVWVMYFVILFVIKGWQGGYTYNFMLGFGPKRIYARVYIQKKDPY